MPVLPLACPESLPAEMDATIVCDVQLGGTDPLGAPVDRIKVVVTAVEADEVRYRLQPLAVGQETDEDRDRDTSTG